MPERKDMAGRDEERQVRGRKGPPTQARSERKRRPAGKGGAKTPRALPKESKRDSERGGPSGDGLH
ncbi:MAG TPA: hypothetical protein VN282_10115 [Pyrinomonadaceae bacterium]|nr:hypothetical protein [Pyrinomonadaceae bacterium]